MTLFTPALRLVATRVAYLLTLFGVSSLQAQSGWQSGCGNGHYDLAGAGIHNLSSYALNIPDGLSSDSIVVEVVGKGAVVPTLCTFSSDTEGPAAESGSSLTAIGSGSHLTTVFRRTMAPASQITVATDDPANTWSVVAYVYRADGSGQSSIGEYANYYIYRANWTASYSLAPASAARDITVRIPITDLDADTRVAYVAASAGGVSASETVAISDLGERLRIVELQLSAVPADATSVDVQVTSPNPTTGGALGDSFIFGVGISSRCDGDFSLVCDGGQRLEVIGAGAKDNPSTSLPIPDPASIDRIVVEVVAKGSSLPATCTFSSDAEGPVNVSGTDVPPTGLGTEAVRVFRHTMAPASNITVSTDDPENTQSVVAYIFRNEDGAAAVGHFANTYLFRDDWNHTYPIATADAPRDVTLIVPISEIDRVGRYAVIQATAGGVTNSITINTSDLGDYLTIAQLVLADVPGSASSVDVTVSSPMPSSGDPGGDSFIFGVVVQTDCGSACEAPAFTDFNFVTPISPIVTWEEIPGAIRYEVCGRPVGSSVWRCHTRTVNFKRFFNMVPGVGHELIVRVMCADGSISEYSPADTIYPMMGREAETIQPLVAEIYPNPAAHEVFVDLSNAEGNTMVELRDLSGRVVAMNQAGEGQSMLRLDVAQLPAGLYLLHVLNGESSRTERLLIAR
jgi:hypothetical protein